MKIAVQIKPGRSATTEERAKFEELVLRDPQVAKKGLSKRIEHAHLLAFLYKDGELIATGAVKCNPKHQAYIAEHSGIQIPQTTYLGEIGYLHTAEGHRTQGHGGRVLTSLIDASENKELFATIQSKNVSSQRLLARHGYVSVGKTWKSDQVDDAVGLYIREPVAKTK